MSTIMDRFMRLRFGEGLTFAEIRHRMKQFPPADVLAAVYIALDNKTIEARTEQHSGCEMTLFRKVSK